MGLIELETLIKAPIERCFDLSRSVDVHMQSTKQTSERAVGGVTSGLMGFGDVVEWEARHFGVTQRITVRISAFDRPRSFRDSQVKGIFASFDHDHFFEESRGGTLMRDVFRFKCPFGILGWIADPVITSHMRKFLIIRNAEIKRIAENPDRK